MEGAALSAPGAGDGLEKGDDGAPPSRTLKP